MLRGEFETSYSENNSSKKDETLTEGSRPFYEGTNQSINQQSDQMRTMRFSEFSAKLPKGKQVKRYWTENEVSTNHHIYLSISFYIIRTYWQCVGVAL